MRPRQRSQARWGAILPDPEVGDKPSRPRSPMHDSLTQAHRFSAPDAHRILDTMVAELQRSMAGLRVPGSPRPYFISYTLRRPHLLELRAHYGSLARCREHRRPSVYAEVRVGNHRFDNVLDGGLDSEADELESSEWTDAPDDLDPRALAVALWKLTQLKFDEAQQDYLEHRKAMVSEFLRDEVDAFTREAPTVHLEALDDAPFPRESWAAALREVSRRFLEHPHVHDPSVGIRAERVQRWLVNSEGSRIITQDVYVEADVAGWVLTDDGVYVEANRNVYRRSVERAPDGEELSRMADEVLAELRELREAKSLGSFVGPALLAGQAASTVMHEALGHRLEGERLVARGETRTFAERVGDRILPPGVDVVDDPTRTEHGGEALFGAYRVDDEGVPAQPVPLVEDGVLRGFLTSRSPVPQFDPDSGARIDEPADAGRSNGHGRHDGFESPMARMGNLVVRVDQDRAMAWEDLVDRLCELARERGQSQAAIIRRIRNGETSTSSYDFQVFKGEISEVHLIDIETREARRVRDVELIGTPLSALQRVVGYGADTEVDQGYCWAESGAVPVSGVAPAMLLSEVELQQRSTSGFHDPLLPPPFADDGSRGRSGRLRQRGRRRK